MDPKEIKWMNEIGFYAYGVQRYMMKQDPIVPT